MIIISIVSNDSMKLCTQLFAIRLGYKIFVGLLWWENKVDTIIKFAIENRTNADLVKTETKLAKLTMKMMKRVYTHGRTG